MERHRLLRPALHRAPGRDRLGAGALRLRQQPRRRDREDAVRPVLHQEPVALARRRGSCSRRSASSLFGQGASEVRRPSPMPQRRWCPRRRPGVREDVVRMCPGSGQVHRRPAPRPASSERTHAVVTARRDLVAASAPTHSRDAVLAAGHADAGSTRRVPRAGRLHRDPAAVAAGVVPVLKVLRIAFLAAGVAIGGARGRAHGSPRSRSRRCHPRSASRSRWCWAVLTLPLSVLAGRQRAGADRPVPQGGRVLLAARHASSRRTDRLRTLAWTLVLCSIPLAATGIKQLLLRRRAARPASAGSRASTATWAARG